MRELSADLAILASQPLSKNMPAHNRALSQLLALSLELDPVNQRARRTLNEHLLAKRPVLDENKKPRESLKRVARATAWLLAEENEESGRSLAILILDPLRILYPQAAVCQNADLTGEAKRWEDVVPATTAFRPPLLSVVSRPETEENSNISPADDSQLVALGAASLATPLLTKKNQTSTAHTKTTISLDLKRSKNPARAFDLIFAPKLPGKLGPKLEERVLNSLKHLHQDLPAGYFAQVRLGTTSYLEDNDFALSGPLALLAHAALSKTKLDDDLFVLAEVEPDGSLAMPALAWEYLRFNPEIRKSGRSRLLVPTSAEAQVRALLATRPSKELYCLEIFGVENLDQALALAKAGQNAETRAEVAKLFSQIQKYSPHKDSIGPSIVAKNKEKLEKILSLEPNHLSAKIFLSLWNGPEQYFVDPKTLRLEFSSCLKLLAPVVEAGGEIKNPKGLSFQEIREQMGTRLRQFENHIPVEYTSTYYRFFSFIELAQNSHLSRGDQALSIEELSLGRRENLRLRGEYQKLKFSVETMGR